MKHIYTVHLHVAGLKRPEVTRWVVAEDIVRAGARAKSRWPIAKISAVTYIAPVEDEIG